MPWYIYTYNFLFHSKNFFLRKFRHIFRYIPKSFWNSTRLWHTKKVNLSINICSWYCSSIIKKILIICEHPPSCFSKIIKSATFYQTFNCTSVYALGYNSFTEIFERNEFTITISFIFWTFQFLFWCGAAVYPAPPLWFLRTYSRG